jgi:hypothetical protein
MPRMTLCADDRPSGEYREVATDPDPSLIAATVLELDWSDVAFVQLWVDNYNWLECSGCWELGFAAVYCEEGKFHVSDRPLESVEEMIPLLQSYRAGDDEWRHMIGWG